MRRGGGHRAEGSWRTRLLACRRGGENDEVAVGMQQVFVAIGQKCSRREAVVTVEMREWERREGGRGRRKRKERGSGRSKEGRVGRKRRSWGGRRRRKKVRRMTCGLLLLFFNLMTLFIHLIYGCHPCRRNLPPQIHMAAM